MLRCRPLAERSSADRRPKPRAAIPCRLLWTGNRTWKVSGTQGSLWLPLEILFSKQTPSYVEICSFCLHRCRCLNEKIKNLQSIRESSRWTVVQLLPLVTKKLKTSQGTQREYSSKLLKHIALLNVFYYLNGRYRDKILEKFSICSDFLTDSLVIRKL